MKSLHVYLSFAGNCEEAMTFFKDGLKADSLDLIRYSDAGDPLHPSEMGSKIYHATLKAGSITMMGSDVPAEHPVVAGTNVNLSLDLKDEAEMDAIFGRLSAGGAVDMALQEVPWGARFGMLTDKFGFHWLLNLDKPKA